METGQAVIRLDHIVKNYGNHEVLKGASLAVNRGDIYGLIGKNGSGKTTLFKIILGLSEFNGGTVSIDGSSTRGELLQARQTIGFFVGANFYPYLSAKENLHYYATVKNIPARNIRKEIERVLELVGLAGVKTPFKGYSLGMKQRLGIANAILGNPEVLILDEPFNFLDPSSQSHIKHILTAYNQETGATILVSSHNLNHTVDICPRIALLENGHIIRDIANHNGEAQAELEDYFEVKD